MTLRQFYLRLAEWEACEQRRDWGIYLMVIKGLKDVPDPGSLFPSLKKRSSNDEEDEIAEEDTDLMNFHHVTAALTPYRK